MLAVWYPWIPEAAARLISTKCGVAIRTGLSPSKAFHSRELIQPYVDGGRLPPAVLSELDAPQGTFFRVQASLKF